MLKLDCLAAGSAVFDLLLTVDRVPRSDERVAAHAVTSGGGGPAATAAYAMVRLGMRVDLVSSVGRDLFGRLILDELHDEGVGVNAVQIVDGPSTTAAVMIEQATGHRSMAVCSGCLQRIDLTAIPDELIAASRCLLLDGNNPTLALNMATRARRLGIPVYLDGGNIPREALDELLPWIDIYIPDNQSVAKQLNGDFDVRDACRELHARGPGLVCITQAEQGVTAFDGSRYWHVPAYCGTSIIDTTGAGDNFHGAFVFAHQRGWEMDAILRFANVFAALCCRGVGGRATVPTYEETVGHVAKFESRADSQILFNQP